jgi:hypothetical protein
MGRKLERLILCVVHPRSSPALFLSAARRLATLYAAGDVLGSCSAGLIVGRLSAILARALLQQRTQILGQIKWVL